MLDSSSLSFPANPTVGQTHDFGGKTYEWNGVGWRQTLPTQIDFQREFRYTAPGTWEKRPGLQYIRVLVQATGGTGAVTGPSPGTPGGGGGAGGFAEGFIPAPSIPGPVAVTVPGPGTTSFGAFLTATIGNPGPSTADGSSGVGAGPGADRTGRGVVLAPGAAVGIGASSIMGIGAVNTPVGVATGFGSGSSGSNSGGGVGPPIVIVEEFY